MFGESGRCFRTGGDEFVVLAELNEAQAKSALNRLEEEMASWSGKTVKELHLAAGYALAAEHSELSTEKLVNEADIAMYSAKTAYYERTGLERRTH